MNSKIKYSCRSINSSYHVDKVIVDNLLKKLVMFLLKHRRLRFKEFFSILSFLRVEKTLWLLFLKALEYRYPLKVKVKHGWLELEWSQNLMRWGLRRFKPFIIQKGGGINVEMEKAFRKKV